MKKNCKICLLLGLILTALLCCGTASAYLDFITEDKNWSVDLIDDKKDRVRITYVGESSHVRIPTHIPYSGRDLPIVWVSLHDKTISSVEFLLETDGGTPVREFYGPQNDSPITGLKISEGVQKVGGFQNCSHLTTVILPSTCTTIDYYAFEHCSSLTNINLDHVITIEPSAFLGTNLPEVLLPEGTAHIGGSAFMECPNLQRVTLPSTLITLESSAFRDCTALAEFDAGEANQITEIPANLLRGCTSLSSVTLPDTITRLKSYSFFGCAALENIDLPESLTAIEGYCFSGCDQITEITLPAGMTVIEENGLPGHLKKFVMSEGIGMSVVPAFAYDDLEELIAPVTVTATRYSSAKLPSLKRATVSRTTLLQGCKETLEEVTLLDSAYTSQSLQGYTALQKVTLPDELTVLPAGAFKDCTSLTEVSFPRHGLTIINTSTFRGCTALEHIEIPWGVTEIGAYAFQGCEHLYDVILPNSLTAIGSYTFADCSWLGSLDVPDSVDSISGSAFQNDWIVLTTRQGLAAWYTAKADPEDGIRVAFRDQVCYPNGTKPGMAASADSITLTAPEVTPEKEDYFYYYFLEALDGEYSDVISGVNLSSATFPGLNTADTSYTGWVVVGYSSESIDPETRDVRTDYNGVRSDNAVWGTAIPAPDFYLPAGLTEIEAEAFEGIAAKAVVIPESVVTISGNPFAESKVVVIYGYHDTWKAWAEDNGYTYMPME